MTDRPGGLTSPLIAKYDTVDRRPGRPARAHTVSCDC